MAAFWGRYQTPPSHTDPTWATTGSARPEPEPRRAQSTSGNFGRCRGDEKALFQRRDGECAVLPQAWIPAHIPRGTRAASARISPAKTQGRVRPRWMGKHPEPAPCAGQVLARPQNQKLSWLPSPRQQAGFEGMIRGVITTAATLIKPTGIRSRETLPSAGIAASPGCSSAATCHPSWSLSSHCLTIFLPSPLPPKKPKNITSRQLPCLVEEGDGEGRRWGMLPAWRMLVPILPRAGRGRLGLRHGGLGGGGHENPGGFFVPLPSRRSRERRVRPRIPAAALSPLRPPAPGGPG